MSGHKNEVSIRKYDRACSSFQKEAIRHSLTSCALENEMEIQPKPTTQAFHAPARDTSGPLVAMDANSQMLSHAFMSSVQSNSVVFGCFFSPF